ncbi:DsbA family protein [Halodurantibacterium flavum]|uniref:DsbA family protein n=1 Tax=Halodurantibacterium flavum TaxID=1382802 RepID=A0ABW4S972_9RHOB
MATRRQLLLVGGGAALWVGGFRALPHLRDRLAGFEFVDLDRPDGFRRLASGGGTTSSGGGFDFMVGLDPTDPLPLGLMKEIADAPRDALFDGSASQATSVAYFFDYYCPYCRILSGHLESLVAAGEIDLTYHHWPIFGEASDIAARAVIAAEFGGNATSLHDRLKQTAMRVTPRNMEELTEDLGLSWPDIARVMKTPAVTMALERTRALSRLFGLIGTPALVVGRTLVQGEIGEGRLRALARLEREEA